MNTLRIGFVTAAVLISGYLVRHADADVQAENWEISSTAKDTAWLVNRANGKVVHCTPRDRDIPDQCHNVLVIP